MRIAITRLEGKEGEDAARCRAFGHECYRVSPIRAIVREERVREFLAEANRGTYDAIFFSSALPAKIIAPRLVTAARIIAIGPATGRVLKEAGHPVEVLPAYYSHALVPYLGDWVRGRTLGIPRADVPNPALIQAVRTAGGTPVETRCYALEPTGQTLDLSGADALLFTSAMSFTAARWERRPGLVLMAVGETTAAAMRTGGVEPAITGDGSLEGTLEALNRPGGCTT